MSDNEKLGVALDKAQCPICTKTFDDTIIMNTVLTKKNADEVKALHGKVTHYQTCKECQDLVDKDYIACIETTESPKEEDAVVGIDVPRTGKIAWVKRKIIPEIFRGVDFSKVKDMIFVDPHVMELLGNIHKDTQKDD